MPLSHGETEVGQIVTCSGMEFETGESGPCFQPLCYSRERNRRGTVPESCHFVVMQFLKGDESSSSCVGFTQYKLKMPPGLIRQPTPYHMPPLLPSVPVCSGNVNSGYY